MPKMVEVYVRNEVASEVYREKGCEHTATGQVDMSRPTSQLQFRNTRKLPEADQEAFRIISEVAKEKGWKVKVYNVSTFSGKLKASLKKVNDTPTIIVDKHRIEGVPKKQYLLSL